MDFKKLEDYWFILCESKDVSNKPKSFKLLNKDIAVYRNQEQKALAFIDKCPHRNIPVSQGRICNGNLVCSFHGWEFNENGHCVKVPGMMEGEKPRAAKLRKYDLIEQEGYIWVRLNQHSQFKPHIPAHISDKSMRTTSFRTHLKCSSLDIAENFLDPFHTPFVHAGIIRTEAKRYRNQIIPNHLENGLEVVYIKDKPQSGFISYFGRQVNKDLGRFLMPGIIELEYYADDVLEFVNTMYITPRSQTESSIYFKASLRPYILPVSFVFAIAGFAIKFALKQDKAILEKQTEMVQKYGGEAFANTELDIVRRQLEYFYDGDNRRVEFKRLEAMI
jgi:phenylpropionate dioxygenase-like ring-hydroxylating dioxygenase large terminal subunit